MKSLRADLAAASRAERTPRADGSSPWPDADDPRTRSREQLHRADAAINEFRASVRSDLRTFVARGGQLETSIIDTLTSALDAAARDITRSLRPRR